MALPMTAIGAVMSERIGAMRVVALPHAAMDPADGFLAEAFRVQLL